MLDYVLALKKQGVIRHIGLSSHTPALVNKVLDRGIVDVVMFSINPAYDYGQGDYGIGENTERYDLYRRCQREGVAITVMKPVHPVRAGQARRYGRSAGLRQSAGNAGGAVLL